MTRAAAAKPERPDFLRACGLPAAWAGQPQWRILATDFGDGLDFLAAWQAWQDDPRRPRLLHFVALTPASAPLPDSLLLAAAAAGSPRWLPLARELSAQAYGLLPGVHRLLFEHGQVLLTLCIGEPERMLRQFDFHADSVLIQAGPGTAEQADDRPQLNVKALARCCRRGAAVAVAADPADQVAALQRHGFVFPEVATPHPASPLRQGRFDPAWEPRGARPAPSVIPGDCLVIGAGLAGAAAAASMARRGWRVRVLDAAAAPARGASGLPAGILVPHSSPDDNLLSRLSRAGVRATWQQALELLVAGRDWAPSGVLEHHLEGDPVPARKPLSEPEETPTTVWSRPADAQCKLLAGLEPTAAADWHEKAAWIRPAALVQAWLARPGIELQTGAEVAQLARADGRWQARDTAGGLLAEADRVIVAAAYGTHALLPGLVLQPVRGQVTWALHEPDQAQDLPPFPVNGDGSFIPAVPTPLGPAWVCGASFERGSTELAASAADQHANRQRLQRLLPAVATHLEPTFAGAGLQAWSGIRCASTDRRPLVGPLHEDDQDGIWMSTAMGSRGLTFAALAAELIAARIHGEPLPLERKLARALYPARQHKSAAARATADE